ncbi:MAG: IgGFc-binding protein, partial [Bacteroidetes bacterium]|nr:IgGFc-binding protein [Bacteroidota bacterium]
NETKVEVKLRGKNLNTSSGCVTDGSAHKIGSTFMLPVMNKWQVINIQDELMDVQNARGKCDFTGSTITSNKPIAMFSFHEGADIPLGAGNRSNLVEQLLPVNMWGKQHISLQLRCAGAVPKPIGNEVLDPDLKVGDYFRVVAAEDATLLNVKWWNTKTGEAIKELKNQRLDTEGSFWEWNENMSYPRQAGILSIQGVALFESNKPVQVMQYSFSSGYATNDYLGATYSPLMVIVPPIEQYVYETVMYTVPYSELRENYINIIAEGDASDSIKNVEMLEKILIGVNTKKEWVSTDKLIEKDETFIRNNIPGTNYYFSSLSVENPSYYVIKGKTKFGAIGYGFGTNTSYGWLASMALIETSKNDTLPPQIYQVSGCVPNIDTIPLGGLQNREKQKGKYKFLTFLRIQQIILHLMKRFQLLRVI